MENVGIRFHAELTELEKAKALVNELKNKRVNIRLKVDGVKDLEKALDLLKQIQSRTINIKLNLPDYKELEKAKALIEELKNAKIDLKINTTELKELENIKALIEELKSENIDIKLNTEETKQNIDDLKTTVEELKEIVEDKKKVEIDTKTAEEELSNLKETLNTLGSAFESVGSTIENWGSRAQNVASSVASAFNEIGNSLTSLGDTFGGDMLDTIGTTLTAYGTMLATQGLGKSVSRYDTLTQYPKVMEAIGYSEDDAQASLNRLNDAVIGTSTPLDEIAEMSKMYSLLTNNLSKGTDMAVSFNNALLASGTGKALQSQALSSLQRLVTVGEFTRKQQWIPLFTGLGASIGYVGEEFGYSRDQVMEFEQALMDGKISGQQFIDALTSAGQKEGILALTELTKSKLSSAIDNLKTRFASLGTDVLMELDKAFTEYDGSGLVDAVKGVATQIKEEVAPYIASIIKDNAQGITDFINKIRSYDWKGLISGIVDNLKQVFSVISQIVHAIPTEMLNKFIAFAMVFASPLGKIITKLGSLASIVSSLNFTSLGVGIALLKGLYDIAFKDGSKSWVENIGTIIDKIKGTIKDFISNNQDTIQHILDNFKNYDWLGLLESVAQRALNIAEMWSSILTKIPTNIASFALTWAIPLGKAISKIGWFVKSLSPMLGIFSKLGSIIGKTSLFKKIGNLFKRGGAIDDMATGVVDYASKFKNLGLVAGYTAEIALIGGVIAEFTKIGEMISNAKIDSAKFSENGSLVAEMIAWVGAITITLTGVMTAVSTSGVGALAVGIGEGLTAGLEVLVAGMGGIIYEFTKIAETISNAKIDSKKLDNKTQDIKDLVLDIQDLFIESGFKEVITGFVGVWGSITSAIEVSAFKGMVKDMNTIFEELAKLGDVKIDDKQFAKVEYVTSKIGTVFRNAYNSLGLEDPSQQPATDFIGKFAIYVGNVIDAWDKENIADEIEQFKNIITNISDAMTELQKIAESTDMDFTKAQTKIDNVTSNIGSMFKNVKKNLQVEKKGYDGKKHKSLPNDEDIENITSIVTNYKATIKKIADSIKDLQKISDSELLASEDKLNGIRDKVTNTVLKLQEIYSTLFDKFKEKRDEKTKTDNGLVQEYYIDDTLNKQIESMVSGMKTMLDNISKSLTSLEEIQKVVEEKELNFKGKEDIAKKIKPIITSLASIWKELETSYFGTDQEYGDGSIPDFGGYINSLTVALTKVQELMTSVQNMQPQIDALVQNGEFSLGDKIKQIVTGIKNIFKDAPSIAKGIPRGIMKGARGNDVGAVEGDTEIFNTSSLDTMVASIENMINKLEGLQAKIDGLGDIGESIGNVVNGIKSVFSEDGANLGENIAGFNLAISSINLKTIPETIQGLFNMDMAFEQMESTIISVAETIADSVTSTFESCASAVQKLIDKCNNLTDAIHRIPTIKTITIKIFADGVLNTISSVANAIRNIPSSKTITFNADTSSIQNIPQGIMQGARASTGGLIGDNGKVLYRAKGGGIFTPKGTDTIPAMLTKGEYVMKRGAVSKLGVDFMQRINNLDIIGAMQSLSASMGAKLMGVTTTNNTYHNESYDNSSRVITVHNHSMGDGMSKLKVGRALYGL